MYVHRRQPLHHIRFHIQTYINICDSILSKSQVKHKFVYAKWHAYHFWQSQQHSLILVLQQSEGSFNIVNFGIVDYVCVLHSICNVRVVD